VALLVSVLMISMSAWADEQVTTSKKPSHSGFSFPLGDNWRVTPYIAPGYTPEMGALLAAGGLLSFKTSMADTVIQRSSLPIVASYSTNKSILLGVILTSYWKEDALRIQADLTLKDMPDHYFGVGYDAGRHTPQSESTTGYHRTWVWFNPRILFRVKTDLYCGLDWDVNYTRATDPGTVMLADPYFQEFGAENFNHGLGFIVQFDSRDIPVNAWGGTYFSGRVRFYDATFGSDNDYQIFDLDFRRYFPLGRPGRTLVWQFRSRTGRGDVPWAELSQPGSPFDLRGYRWGQYRDKAMVYSILEFRNMIADRDREPDGISPHGVVAWIAAGSLAERANEYKNWLPNFGVGYRFEVQPRMNVRLDIGFADDVSGWSPAFYFNFNEAF